MDLQIVDGWRSKEGSDDNVLERWGPLFKPDVAFLTADDGRGKW